MQKYISKSLMGQDIGRDTSLRVLGSTLSLQRTHLKAKGKASKEKQSSIAPAKVREQVCKLYHILIPTYTKIVSGDLSNRQVYVSGRDEAGRSGNQEAKETRIP